MDTDITLAAQMATREFVLNFKKLSVGIFAKYDMTFADGRIMVALKKGEASTKAELSNYVKLKPAGLTRALDRLVEQGYIDRKTCSDDKRCVRLTLTKQGFSLGNKIRNDFLKVWQALLVDSNENEVAEYIHLLKKMNTVFAETPDLVTIFNS